MKTEEVKRLLEAFYNGETTREEEATLRQFFSGETPTELNSEKAFFLRIAALETKNQAMPGTLKASLDSWFDALEKPKKKPIRTVWMAIAGAAAVVAFVLAFYFRPAEVSPDPMIAHVEFSDEDREELARALEMVSYNLNRGLEDLDEIPKTLERTQEMLNN